MRKIKLTTARNGERRAEFSACVGYHEIDMFRRNLLGSHYEIAFILTVFVIDNDDEFAVAESFDSFLYAVKFYFLVVHVYVCRIWLFFCYAVAVCSGSGDSRSSVSCADTERIVSSS